jgi:tRNA pseudouridine13 synthase
VDLPYLTAALPGIGGVLRASPEDFVVDEEPAYLPSGAGDHVFVRIEKRGLSTPQAIERIARALGVAVRDIGVAGLKDRHAVTRQWLSLPPPVTPAAVTALALDDVVVLEHARHPHKLRTGHVRANRFVLRVRDVTADAEARARAIVDALAIPPGAPNWYGEQRFGRSGDNAERGLAIVRGERPPRDRKLARLLVSALQSKLFNDWLVARMADGLYARVVAGDILHKRRALIEAPSERSEDGAHLARSGSLVNKQGGGMFACEDPGSDEPRLRAGELCVTGPMFGDRMRTPPPGSAAYDREQRILAAAGLSADTFASVRAIAEGTRRDATIQVGAPEVRTVEPGVVEVGFSLPGGAYATAVMRELMKSR